MGRKQWRRSRLLQSSPSLTGLVINVWTEQPDFKAVDNHWTGLLEWTTGLDCWNGLLEWTTGLTFFALKIIFILSNKSQLLVELHSIRNGTYLAAQTHLEQANT